MQENEKNNTRNLFCYLYKNDCFNMDSIFHFFENLKKQVIHPYV